MASAATRPDGAEARWGFWRWALAFGVLGFALRLAWPVGLDLYGDEAYYYLWSRHLAFGYFDHPPLVAWLCALGHALGPSELALRLPFAFCGGLSVVFAVALTAELTDDRRAPAIAGLLAAVAPLGIVTSALALPDAPLSAAITACLWLLLREKGSDLAWAGLAFGLGLLAKYSAATLLPGVVWILLRDPTARGAFRRPTAWLGVGLALAVFAPCLAWNAEHGFISLAFQLHHASGRGIAMGTLVDFVGVELVGAGPLGLVLALPYLWRTQTRAARRLAALTLSPLAWFAYAAVRGKFEANWPAFLDPALCAAAAAAVIGFRERLAKALWISSSALAAAATLAIGLELRHPRLLPASNVSVARFHQGRALARGARALTGPGEPFVFTYDYPDAGELAFYGGFTRLGSATERPSQLDVWNDQPAPGEAFYFLGFNGLDPHSAARFPGARATGTQRYPVTLDGNVVRGASVTALDHFTTLAPR